MSTYFAKPGEVAPNWYVIDAEGQILGRLATEVANLLRGKNKPQYTPHVDVGDYVVIINADKIQMTGKKLNQKEFFTHSGYPGGLKRISYDKFIATKPEKAIFMAVKRMVPITKLGKQQMSKLKVYAGGEHPHVSQKPQEYKLEKAS